MSFEIINAPWAVPDLVEGHTYLIRMRAINTGGYAGPVSSDGFGVVVLAASAPTITSVVEADHQLTINFDAPTDNGNHAITNYEYSLDGGITYRPFSPAKTTSPYTITGLTNWTTYLINLRAVNSIGSGRASEQAHGQPGQLPPTPTITKIEARAYYGYYPFFNIYFTLPGDNFGGSVWYYEYAINGGPFLSGGLYSELHTASPMTGIWKIAGQSLLACTDYSIVVRGVNGYGPGQASSAVEVKTAVPAGAPQITSIVGSEHKITVYFTPGEFDSVCNSSITNYSYSLDDGATFIDLDPASVINPIVIGGLQNSVSYPVRLRSFSVAGYSEASDTVYGVPNTQSGPPVITSADVSDTYALIYFDAPTDNGGAPIDAYEYSIDGGYTFHANSSATTSSPFNIEKLQKTSTYGVRIRAITAAGPGIPSELFSITTITKPEAPTILSVTPGDQSITVAFKEVASSGGAPLTGYKCVIHSPGLTGDQTVIVNSITSPIVINSAASVYLVNSQTYTIKLYARSKAGFGVGVDGPDVVPARPPTAPTITNISQDSGHVNITFTPPSSNGGSIITGYKYTIDDGTTFTNVIYGTPGGPTGNDASLYTMVKIDLLPRNAAYSVKIAAVNGAGIGTNSNSADITVLSVPYSPRDLVLTVLSSSSVSIGFNAPSNDGGSAITNYEYSLNRGIAPFIPVSPATATSPIIITGLTQGTTYSTVIRAVNSVGAGYVSSPIDIKAGTTPQAPTITAVSSNLPTLQVSFTAPVDGGGYTINNYQYSIDGGNTYATLSPANNISPLTITNVTVGNSYTVKLKAVNALGVGLASNGITGKAISAPSAPTITSVVAINTQLAINFTQPASDGGSTITNYEYSLDNGLTYLDAATYAAWTGLPNPINVSNLRNGVTYSVRIRGRNVGGIGALSNTVTATPATLPKAPRITSTLPSNGRITLNIQPPADTGGASILGYKYSLSPGPASEKMPYIITSPISLPGTNGQAYDIKIWAVNRMGDSVDFASTTATPLSASINAPTITNIAAGDGSIVVTYSMVAGTLEGTPLTNYKYSVDGGTTYTALNPSNAALSGSFTVSGLNNEAVYTVKMRAVNAAGDGVQSAGVQATPRGAPSTPTITSVVAGNQSLALNFTQPASPKAAVTNYEYSLNGGDTYIARSPASILSPLVITGLTNGVTCVVRLRSLNANGLPSATAAEPPTNANDCKPGTALTLTDIPEITAIAADEHQLTITYSMPQLLVTVANILNHKYSLDNGVTWTALAPARTALTDTFTVTGLINFKDYEPRMKAVNALGDGYMSVGYWLKRPTGPPPVYETITNDNYGTVYRRFNNAVSGQPPFFLIEITLKPFEYPGAIKTSEISLDGGTTWRTILPFTNQTGTTYYLAQYDSRSPYQYAYITDPDPEAVRRIGLRTINDKGTSAALYVDITEPLTYAPFPTILGTRWEIPAGAAALEQLVVSVDLGDSQLTRLTKLKDCYLRVVRQNGNYTLPWPWPDPAVFLSLENRKLGSAETRIDLPPLTAAKDRVITGLYIRATSHNERGYSHTATYPLPADLPWMQRPVFVVSRPNAAGSSLVSFTQILNGVQIYPFTVASYTIVYSVDGGPWLNFRANPTFSVSANSSHIIRTAIFENGQPSCHVIACVLPAPDGIMSYPQGYVSPRIWSNYPEPAMLTPSNVIDNYIPFNPFDLST